MYDVPFGTVRYPHDNDSSVHRQGDFLKAHIDSAFLISDMCGVEINSVHYMGERPSLGNT